MTGREEKRITGSEMKDHRQGELKKIIGREN
jgi:hypothetical protein